MKKAEIEVGKSYVAKVSDNLVPVKITGLSPYGGWEAVNQKTGKRIRVRSAARLRYPARVGERER